MRKRYKKLATIIPLTSMLSMSAIAVTPATSFAAETQKADVSSSQEGLIQGYQMENGKMTPVYKNKLTKFDTDGDVDPGLPLLPENPYNPIPDHGTAYVESTDIGDTVYFEPFANTIDGGVLGGKNIRFPSVIPSKKYPTIGYFVQKQANGQIRDGYYNPEDLSLITDSNHLSDYGYTQAQIDLVQKDLNQTYSVIWDGTSKLKRETNYKLLPDASGLQNDAAAFGYNQTLTSGVSTTNMFGFATTAGWKMGIKVSVVPLVADVTSEISASLTASFQHTVNVTKQTSSQVKFDISRVDNPDYKYNDYAAAVYKIQSDYTLLPGKGLSSIVGSQELQYDNAPRIAGLANTNYAYEGSKYYFTVTPGSHKKSV
ncbi:hypothetical protein LW858_31320 (plasmid) [Bacillus cereus]|uniref:WxL domain-containing protein n=2 Tax=Bacillus cereus TaxID=1396 RepID=A0A9X6GC75_BACCE|nr:hypothetical protein [Bacillus cereus]OOR71144.1 hypothetical protein BLX06_32390 [Bacillus cereus]UIJ69651.1 hypothetical protein LW858_31320 [Bacillus cereus]